jgi:hypothetical protein
LVASLPGIFGEERVRSEKLRLANLHQPMRVKPVGVTHSANMADPEKWVNPLRGYAYDSFNPDALLRLAKVENGRMVLPGGASYKVVVLPLEHPMNPNSVISDAAKAKIEELRRGGVIIPTLPYQAEDFSAMGMERDVVVPAEVAWTHRRNEAEQTDLYFVANQSDEPKEFIASFRISGRQPEWWNPMNGTITETLSWSQSEGRTKVKMKLAAGESAFIVFRKPAEVAEGNSFLWEKSEPLPATSWNIRFEKTAQEVTTNELFDWTAREEDAIRYYSGRATYQTTFNFKRKQNVQEACWLELNGLHDVASVKLNGVECGIVWTAPYRVEIGSALKKGTNTLEIAVCNTWANALNGAEQGKAPFDGIWTNATYRRAEKNLLPAGLVGPVKLVYGNR